MGERILESSPSNEHKPRLRQNVQKNYKWKGKNKREWTTTGKDTLKFTPVDIWEMFIQKLKD